MDLSQYVHTFGHDLQARHGQRVHKVALNVGFTCPNRDGTKGRGGCTFCNNDSFAPSASPTAVSATRSSPVRGWCASSTAPAS
jgi:radical SAM superfamily enzyme